MKTYMLRISTFIVLLSMYGAISHAEGIAPAYQIDKAEVRIPAHREQPFRRYVNT